MHRPAADEALFFLINRIDRAPEFFAAAGLHLGKDKRLLIPADKIDLTSPWSTEVPAKYLPTQPFQMTGGGLLSPSPQLQMIRTRRRAGRPVQNRGDDAGKVHDHEA